MIDFENIKAGDSIEISGIVGVGDIVKDKKNDWIWLFKKELVIVKKHMIWTASEARCFEVKGKERHYFCGVENICGHIPGTVKLLKFKEIEKHAVRNPFSKDMMIKQTIVENYYKSLDVEVPTFQWPVFFKNDDTGELNPVLFVEEVKSLFNKYNESALEL